MPPSRETPIRGCAIVLLGSFNPPIFQPGWFARHGMIEDDLAKAATDVHIDADAAFFLTSEFGCEVTRDRLRLFSVPTTDRREQLGDVAANAFGVLYHTPVGGISMVSFQHVPAKRRAWATFAPVLASNDNWDGFLAGATVLDRIVLKREIPGPPPGVLGLAAEESTQRKGGVYLSLTHQYTLAGDAADHAEVASQLLRTTWESAISEGDDLIERVLAA